MMSLRKEKENENILVKWLQNSLQAFCAQGLALSFTTLMLFTDHIHQQDKPHQSALASRDDLCNT